MSANTTVPGVLERARRHRRKYGLAATAARAGQVAFDGVRAAAYMSEAHVWYELDVNGPRPRVPLEPGLDLRQGGPTDIPLLEPLNTIGPQQARRRLADGHDLWFVLDGSRPMFSCSVFYGSMPDISMKSRVLSLPAGTAALEDSMVAPAARGKALGPAAWTLIADVLAARGLTRLITKVALSNVPTQKAAIKVGFREVAIVRYRKLGPWFKRTVKPAGNGFASYLASPADTPTGSYRS